MKWQGDVSLNQLMKNKVPKQEWTCTVCTEQFTFEYLLNQHCASKHNVQETLQEENIFTWKKLQKHH